LPAIVHLKCIITGIGVAMAPRYIERSLKPVLKRAAGEFPAVVLTGPRQSGKTPIGRMSALSSRRRSPS
jgi:hypothetical protein